MHVGATIRVLRVGAGIGLRELAERVGVSSAYLSRVENGRDGAPTAERLGAIARELGVPEALFFEVAGRLSPVLSAYLQQVPAAGALFLEIARRDLDADAVARLRELLERELPSPARAPLPEAPPLSEILAPERMVLNLASSRVGDVLDVLASRLSTGSDVKPRQLSERMRAREQESSTCLGSGVMVPQAFAPGPPLAALVTLTPPLGTDTPDGAPLKVVIGVRASERGWGHLARLAEVTRLAAQGGVEALCRARTPAEVHAALTTLERFR